MRFGLDDWICEKIIHTLQQFPLVKTAVIFGSRATGTFKNYSDIDLAIYAPAMNEQQFADLFVALDGLPFLYKMDIVRVETLQNDILRGKIETQGVILFERESPL